MGALVVPLSFLAVWEMVIFLMRINDVNEKTDVCIYLEFLFASFYFYSNFPYIRYSWCS